MADPSLQTTIIGRTARGMGTLPGYGSHPGVPIVVWLIVGTFGALALHGGWTKAVVGAALQAGWAVPLLLVGAYQRATESERGVQSHG